MSVSGVSADADSMYSLRNGAVAKGNGWGLIDIAALSAIQMLILVEFATNNVQTAIGNGYTNNNDTRKATGSCDNVPNLTGRPAGTSSGKVDVVWRGIEGVWGNACQWVDGVIFDGTDYYVSNAPSEYGTSDYKSVYDRLPVGISSGVTEDFIVEMSLINGFEHVMLPVKGGGGESVHYCDTTYRVANNVPLVYGGKYDDHLEAGLFYTKFEKTSNTITGWITSRLLYIPS
jgi:hypothetical protein